MPMSEGTDIIKKWQGFFDFAVETGAIGTYVLRSSDGQIPIGSFVMGGWMEVETLFTTSASGTGALQVNAANDLQTATIVSGAPFSTTGIKAITPAFTAATAIKTTAARSPSFLIATGAITAGKFNLVLFYV